MASNIGSVKNPDSHPPADAYPPADAIADAMSVIQDAAKSEDTRFNSFNTRAVAVLSASSIVTALAGLYGKEILGPTFTGWLRPAGIVGLVVALVFLVLVALTTVVGVLYPRRRSVFGDNALTDDPASIANELALQRLVFDEYRHVHHDLVARNSEKARALTWGYVCLLAAIFSIAATVVVLTIGKH